MNAVSKSEYYSTHAECSKCYSQDTVSRSCASHSEPLKEQRLRAWIFKLSIIIKLFVAILATACKMTVIVKCVVIYAHIELTNTHIYYKFFIKINISVAGWKTLKHSLIYARVYGGKPYITAFVIQKPYL